MTILLTLLACATQGNGVEANELREVDEFSGVKNTTFIEVNWDAGPDRAELICDENLLEYISTTVEDGELVIRTPNNMLINTRLDCRLDLQSLCLNRVSLSGSGSFNSPDACALRELKLSGSGGVTIGAVVSDSLDIHTSGSGSANVQDIATDSLIVEHSGSGGSTLSGEAGALDLHTSGSGGMNASALLSYDLTARISGSGSSSVEMDGPVEAKLSGSGSLNLSGNPGPVDAEESGSGRVND